MKGKRKFFGRIVSFLTVFALTIPTAVQLSVSAEETEKYPYSLFGRNGITMTATSNMCINGAVHTNKEAEVSASNKNINGKLTTGNDIEKRIKHVYADTKIYENYFTENCDLYEEEYVYSELNIHINNPLFCYNNITLNGNVSLNSNLGTYMNLNVTGEVKNANTSVVYSKYGNITIENDSTANINGLIYAPLGTVTINSPNVTINGVIIADKVVINSSNVNINYNDNIARFIGTVSEAYDFSGLEYLPEEWLGDTDEDELFDIYEKVIDTDPLDVDTDDDYLPDGYEVLTLNTDPLEVDTDENGISDADEDFDTDNLNNLGEYQNGTQPYNPDTDEDGFLDGDEVNKYKTEPLNPDTDEDGLLDGEESYDGSIYAKSGVYFNPLNPDTDGDGILDGDEVFAQRKQQTVETHDEAITEIIVDMDTNGNLERNLTIESMYDIDAMSSNVYALIGEPFNFETPTSFNSAKITFKVDKTKLGDTKFDNLLILWYNEEEQIFEEMETIHDEANSTVSTTTTHFSQYMIVDSEKWYANWETSFNELRKMWDGGTSYYKSMNTIFIIDCSNDVDPENYRLAICQNILNNMQPNDQAAAITYSHGIKYSIGFHDPQAISECLERNIDNFGPSKALVAAFNSAMYMVYNSSADMNRIVILTTSSSDFTAELYKYDLNNVIVNAVNLGDYKFGDAIENITNLTGGDIYNIATADELTYQYGDKVYIPPQFIGKDSDGDGIPDLVEDCGLLPNSQPLGTSKLLKDSDGDGIPDNEEFNISLDNLTYEIDKQQYTNAIYISSLPSDEDSDNDGLKDGERIRYNNKVLLPIDPEPLIYNGPLGVWKAQRKMAESGNIPVSYTSDRGSSNEFMNEKAQDAKSLVDTLLKCKVIANEYIVGAFKWTFKDSAENGIAEVFGADFLDFIYDNQNMAYHSQVETWQKAFGYNDIYDRFFDYGSAMDRNRIRFYHKGQEYILWEWKGDYWNLQGGAEMGLYVYNRTVNGEKHYDVVDFNLPMTLSLYRLDDGFSENIFSWVPNENQWWITGFNPDYTEPSPHLMVTIGSVDFTGYEEMYKHFKETHEQDKNADFIFDDDYHTVWILWEK